MSRDLDIWCAQTLGWTVRPWIGPSGTTFYTLRDPQEQATGRYGIVAHDTEATAWLGVPHYSIDLAAAQSLEAVIAERGLQEKYADCLMEVISEELYYGHLGSGLDSFEVWTVATATAEQRVRAFLATIEAFAASGRRST